MGSAEESTVLVVPLESAQKIRSELETLQVWDATHKLKKLTDSNHVAIPIIVNEQNKSLIADKWPDFEVTRTCLPISKKVKVKQNNPAVRLRDEIGQLLKLYGISEELLNEVPSKWEKHGDLVIIPTHSFSSSKWAAIGDQLWEVVAKCLACRRLARHSAIANNGFRSSRVIMLIGQNGEVTHVDNGIRYTYDVTKCMFSPGNITEKLRVASLDCSNETVVDLYVGIGYFTLPYLAHAKAGHVHACEWNPDAVIALKRNLLINGVAERCTIHEGDNRMLQLPPVADRVNLGLIPSSEEGWPVAVRVLKLSGGILHIHGNVTAFSDRKAMDGKTSDFIGDKFQQIDVSENRCCKLDASRQRAKENVLITDDNIRNLSCFYQEGTAMNTAELDQKIRNNAQENRNNSLESCKDLKTNSGISYLSGSFLCGEGDVSSQPEEHTLYLPCENSLDMDQRWRQTSSQSITSNFDCEFTMVAVDSRKNVNLEDSRKEHDMNSKDTCQSVQHTCTDYTDKELDQINQNRNETNVLLACEQWSQYVQRQIKSLLETKKGGSWAVTKLHLEIVKSYAPHIVHVVLDLECRPV
ncbi:unnamed protein product [Candidula unifasciata]|uniref:tRNA(Phe) (4-demethylwyosine(37)-C(7)) aminocarboxypropyltransferase n=1 Tax=Candidula unifasciata TaxID=100452 RepID=A0A8S3YGJ8_9EUPU|nr:unnamed protein product [Candidula unifasciata]